MQMIDYLLLALGFLAMLGLIFAFFIPADSPLERPGAIPETTSVEKCDQ
jgi:hypothetical protein